MRAVSFELNGVPRTLSILDRSVVVEVKSRPKSNPDDPREIGAPIPGKITQVTVTVGHKVSKVHPGGDDDVHLCGRPLAGVVHRIEVVEWDVVDVKDLLLSLR